MAQTLRTVVDLLNDRLDTEEMRALASTVDGGVVVHLHVLDGDLAPGWFLHVGPNGAQVSEGFGGTPEVVIDLHHQTALALVNGDITVDDALRAGRVKFGGSLQDLRRFSSSKTSRQNAEGA